MTLEPLYTPAAAAPLIGKCAKEVQKLCSGRQITCVVDESPGGRRRYFIPESAIREFNNRRTVRRT